MLGRQYSHFTLPILIALALLVGGCSSPPFESGETVMIVPGEIRIGSYGLVPIWAKGQVIEYKDNMIKIQVREAETAGDREWSREWPVGDTVWLHADELVSQERGQAALERQRLAAGYATDLVLGGTRVGEELGEAIRAAEEEGLDDLNAMLSFQQPLAATLDRAASLESLDLAIQSSPESDGYTAFAAALQAAGESLGPDAHKVAVEFYQTLDHHQFRGLTDQGMRQMLMASAAGTYAGHTLHRIHQTIQHEDAFSAPEATENVLLLERALLTALTGGGDTPLAASSDPRSFDEWLDDREADVRRQRSIAVRDEILAEHRPSSIDEDSMEAAFSDALADASDVEPLVGVSILKESDKETVYLRWTEQRIYEAQKAWDGFQEKLGQFARREFPINSLNHWHHHLESVETVDQYLRELEGLDRKHGDLVPEVTETLVTLRAQQRRWNEQLEKAAPVFEQFVHMVNEGDERGARDLAVPGVGLQRRDFRLRSGEYHLRDKQDLFVPAGLRVRRVTDETARQGLLAVSRRFVDEINRMMIVDVQAPDGSWVEDIRLYHHDEDWFLGTRWW